MEDIEAKKKKESKLVKKILDDAMVNKNTSYHGNPLLKGPKEEVALTKDHIKEIIKCKNDPLYFAENYIKIVNVDEGLIPIKLYPYQKTLLKGLSENRYSIILSCRQSGKCVTAYTKVRLKNKNFNNGIPFEIAIGDFYNWLKFCDFYKNVTS